MKKTLLLTAVAAFTLFGAGAHAQGAEAGINSGPTRLSACSTPLPSPVDHNAHRAESTRRHSIRRVQRRTTTRVRGLEGPLRPRQNPRLFGQEAVDCCWSIRLRTQRIPKNKSRLGIAGVNTGGPAHERFRPQRGDCRIGSRVGESGANFISKTGPGGRGSLRSPEELTNEK